MPKAIFLSGWLEVLCTYVWSFFRPVLSNVVFVFAEDHELSQGGGKLRSVDGFFCVCDGLVISSQLMSEH